jgi:hypothetical protein
LYDIIPYSDNFNFKLLHSKWEKYYDKINIKNINLKYGMVSSWYPYRIINSEYGMGSSWYPYRIIINQIIYFIQFNNNKDNKQDYQISISVEQINQPSSKYYISHDQIFHASHRYNSIKNKFRISYKLYYKNYNIKYLYKYIIPNLLLIASQKSGDVKTRELYDTFDDVKSKLRKH